MEFVGSIPNKYNEMRGVVDKGYVRDLDVNVRFPIGSCWLEWKAAKAIMARRLRPIHFPRGRTRQDQTQHRLRHHHRDFGTDNEEAKSLLTELGMPFTDKAKRAQAAKAA